MKPDKLSPKTCLQLVLRPDNWAFDYCANRVTWSVFVFPEYIRIVLYGGHFDPELTIASMGFCTQKYSGRKQLIQRATRLAYLLERHFDRKGK